MLVVPENMKCTCTELNVTKRSTLSSSAESFNNFSRDDVSVCCCESPKSARLPPNFIESFPVSLQGSSRVTDWARGDNVDEGRCVGAPEGTAVGLSVGVCEGTDVGDSVGV